MKKENEKLHPELLLDGDRGIYIPQQFARLFWQNLINAEELEDEKYVLLAGPEGEFYWDAWATVLDNAVLKGEYTLFQDSDLWALPANYDWDGEQFVNQ